MAKEATKTLQATEKFSLNSLVLLFFAASVLGWIFEVILYLVFSNVLINPGVLHGPWLPIYGVSSVLIVLLTKRWKGKPVAVFLFSMLLCGTTELLTGSFLEMVTGAQWWDYSHLTFSLGAYLSLESLLLFGILGIFLVYAFAPACEKVLMHIPKRVQGVVFGILFVIFAGDVVFSCIHPNYLMLD